MNIGLYDLDGHNFPNLVLMKISAYEKKQGNNVEWINHFKKYDRVYKSKVFTFTPEDYTYINSNEIIKGGTGYGLNNELTYDIEHQYPDYSIYNIQDVAYGFLSRGCPRGCGFCIVSEKEGKKSIQVADIKEFWNGQKQIKLLDPNLLACKDWKDLITQLIETGSLIDFTQGLDIRFIDDEKIEYINKLKVKMIHFAWDNYEFNTYEILKLYRKSFKIESRKLRVYILTNYNTTIEQDLERIYKLRELDYDPYVMIYNKHESNDIIKQISRWVNNKYIWRSCNRFELYKP